MKVTATAPTSGLRRPQQLPRLPGAEGLQSSWGCARAPPPEGDTAPAGGGPQKLVSAGPGAGRVLIVGCSAATLGGGHAKDGRGYEPGLSGWRGLPDTTGNGKSLTLFCKEAS